MTMAEQNDAGAHGSDAEPVKAPKKGRDPIREALDRWLERANRNPELPLGAFKVLYFVSNHASIRASGFTWFSIPTIAGNTAMSISAVRRALAAALKHGFLMVISGGDKRRPNEYWPVQNGIPIIPGFADALAAKMAIAKEGALRPKAAVPKQRDGRSGKFTSAKNDAALRSKMAQDNGQFCHRTFLTDLPNRSAESDSATTESGSRKEPSSLPTPGIDSKIEEKKEKEALALAAELLGFTLNTYRRAAWRKQLAQLAAEGIDADHVVAAVAYEVRRRLEVGRDLDISALTWFRQPALGVRLVAMGGTEWRDRTTENINFVRHVRERLGATRRVGTETQNGAQTPAKPQHAVAGSRTDMRKLDTQHSGKSIAACAREMLASPAERRRLRIDRILDLFGVQAAATNDDRRWVNAGLAELARYDLDSEIIPTLRMYIPPGASSEQLGLAWQQFRRSSLPRLFGLAQDELRRQSQPTINHGNHAH